MSNRAFFNAMCLYTAGMFSAYAACAQHPYSKDTVAPRTLKTVEILSSIRRSSVTPVQTLGGAALEKMNSLSVADAARFFSGVQLKDYGGIGGLKTLNVRSMGANHTGVFYDGIQLGNAQNGQVDLGRFSLDNLEQIDLYNAQKGVILQPAKGFATAAAIYLQSRRPLFTEGKKVNTKVSFKTGSFGLINPAVRLEQKLSERLSAAISSEWTHAHGRYKFRYTNGVYDTTAIRKNADIDAWRVEGGLYGLLKDSSAWQVKAYYYNSNRGLPGAIVSNKWENGQRQWDRNAFLQASFSKNIGKRYSLLLNAKYADDHTRYLDSSIKTTTGNLVNRFHQQEWYLSAANRYQLTTYWNVALSGDVQLNRMNANIYRFPYPARYTSLVALASQLHFKRFELQGSLLGTFVNETVKSYTAGNNRKEYTPTLMASWQPFTSPDWRVRAFYKNIFRMPTFNDLYYSFVGNTALRPEYTRQYNAGISYNKQVNSWLQYVTIQADAYYNTVKDKIVAVPSGKLFRWMMMNIGKVDITGLDAGAQLYLEPVAGLQTDLSFKYTYQQALDLTLPGEINYKHQVAYIPLHSGSFTVNTSWKRLDLHYSFIYTGERYFENTNRPETYIEPWYTSDLSLSVNTGYRNKKIRLTGEVNNLFNQYYDVVINFPMPGRYYRFSVSISY